MSTIEMKPVGTVTMKRRSGVAVPSAYKIWCAAAASLLLGLSSNVTAAPNILLIIGDDMSVEALGYKKLLIQRVIDFTGSLWIYSEGKMEARPGIEPRSAALQAAA